MCVLGRRRRRGGGHLVNGARLRKLQLGICLGRTQKRWRAARRERSVEAELVADMKFSPKRSNPERICSVRRGAGRGGSQEEVKRERVDGWRREE